MAVLVRRPPILSIPKPASGGSGTPTLVQGMSWGANPVGKGISGDDFLANSINPVGSNNCTIVFGTYPSGSTPTLSDNNGNTWGAPTKTADNGAGNYASSAWVLPGSNGGQTQYKAHVGAQIIPFQWEVWEFCNVATASAVDGAGSAAAGVSAPNLACGSLTTTADGDLILAYYALAAIANNTSHPTDFVPGGSFKLLNGNISWFANDGFWHASGYFVQGSHGSINPGMTATGDTNVYNCVAVALKAANAGTPRAAGIKIIRLCHFTVPFVAATGTYHFKCPSDGNLRVIANAVGVNQVTVASNAVTDSDGNTYTIEQPNSTTCPYFFFAPNQTPTNNTTASIAFTGKQPAGASWRYWDIAGAAASPFDTAAGFPQTNETGVTTVNNAPSIIPGVSSGLMLASAGAGQGPVTFAAGVPAAAIFDAAQYAGISDIDLMDNADGVAHYYFPNASQVNWNWTIPSTSNDVYATAITFKAA